MPEQENYQPGQRFRLRRAGRLHYRVAGERGGMLVRAIDLSADSELVVLAGPEPGTDRAGRPVPAPPLFQSADDTQGYLEPAARGWPVADLLTKV